MMHCAFKLHETISKQIYFWGGRKTETPKKEARLNGKLKVCLFQFENGTKPPAESQLT